jgi:hypothetical protein
MHKYPRKEKIMKELENIYKITYKNGNTLQTKALSMFLENGLVYQLSRHFSGMPYPSILNGEKIEKIDCIERNNDIDFEK